MTRREFSRDVAVAALGTAMARRGRSESPEPITHTYKTVPGCQIQADVYGASEGAAKPAVLWIHGGALMFGSRRSLTRPFHAALLGHGYVVVSIDYRLAPETKLPEIIEDLRDAYRWMHKQADLLGIDRKRIAVAGGSAGGYLTQMSGFCVKPRPRALVSYFGYGDIIGPWQLQPSEFYRRQPLVSKDDAYTAVGSTPISDPPEGNLRVKFYLYCRQNGLWTQEASGRDPYKDPKWFKRYCPIRNVKGKYPPTLLIHGTADTDVPYSLSHDMDAKLTEAHVPHEFITVAGAGHGLSDATPEEVARAAERAVAFVNAHTA